MPSDITGKTSKASLRCGTGQCNLKDEVHLKMEQTKSNIPANHLFV